MLQELAEDSENHCRRKNNSATKVMMENDTPLYIDAIQIETVDSYNYVGQRYNSSDKNKNRIF